MSGPFDDAEVNKMLAETMRGMAAKRLAGGSSVAPRYELPNPE